MHENAVAQGHSLTMLNHRVLPRVSLVVAVAITVPVLVGQEAHLSRHENYGQSSSATPARPRLLQQCPPLDLLVTPVQGV